MITEEYGESDDREYERHNQIKNDMSFQLFHKTLKPPDRSFVIMKKKMNR